MVGGAVALHPLLHDDGREPDRREAEALDPREPGPRVGARPREPPQVSAVVPADVGRVEARHRAPAARAAAVVRGIAVRVAVRHHEVDALDGERGVRDRLRERGELGAAWRRDRAGRRRRRADSDRDGECERRARDRLLTKRGTGLLVEEVQAARSRSRAGRCRRCADRAAAGSCAMRFGRATTALSPSSGSSTSSAPSGRTCCASMWRCAIRPEPSASTSSIRPSSVGSSGRDAAAVWTSSARMPTTTSLSVGVRHARVPRDADRSDGQASPTPIVTDTPPPFEWTSPRRGSSAACR